MMDDEKTKFAPRKFGIAAKTVVMNVPPRMTSHLRVASPPEALQAPAGPGLAPAAPRLPPSAPRQETFQTQAQRNTRVALPSQGLGRATAVAPIAQHAFDPRATRMAVPPLPKQAGPSQMPMEFSTGELIRGPQTRLARSSRPARHMPVAAQLPASYLEPAKPPPRAPSHPPSSDSSGLAGLRRRLQQKNARPTLLIGLAAVLAALVFLLPLSSPSASSQTNASAKESPESNPATEKIQQASAQSKGLASLITGSPRDFTSAATTPEQEPPKAEQRAEKKPEARAEKTLEAATKMKATNAKAAGTEVAKTSASEERAAAMLLSGRRAEALQLYQALASSESSSPGVEAMVLVLSQKVGAQ